MRPQVLDKGRMEKILQAVERQYLTKAQACLYTSLSERTLDYARERGELEWYKVGKRVLLQKKSLDAFLERHRAGADLDKIVNDVVSELGA